MHRASWGWAEAFFSPLGGATTSWLHHLLHQQLTDHSAHAHSCFTAPGFSQYVLSFGKFHFLCFRCIFFADNASVVYFKMQNCFLVHRLCDIYTFTLQYSIWWLCHCVRHKDICWWFDASTWYLITTIRRVQGRYNTDISCFLPSHWKCGRLFFDRRVFIYLFVCVLLA